MAEIKNINTVEKFVAGILDEAISKIQSYESKDRHDSIVKSAMTLSLNQLVAQMEDEKKEK